MDFKSLEDIDIKSIEQSSKPSNNRTNDSIANLKKIALFIFQIFKGVILLFILAVLFRLFIIQPFLIDGPSMEPNFYDNEYLLVNKITSRFFGYQRGDVVIFKNPQDKKLIFIKRIIGLPGEKIEIEKGKIKITNAENPKGIILKESYLPSDIFTSSADGFQKSLNSDEYLVFGDNRKNSLDSREFGPVSKKLIIGKVWFSFKTFKIFPKPQYNVLLPTNISLYPWPNFPRIGTKA